MTEAYTTWIAQYAVRNNNVLAGFCYSASVEMQKAFPELILCRGYVYESREHWWLKTLDGEIVDPTAAQFTIFCEVLLKSDYEEYSPEIHGPEPIGRCMKCGDYCYESVEGASSIACGTECLAELNEYYNGKIKFAR
ncbi:MAG: hypothetical protein UY48_C0006G0051 [Candidatus Gottesmanbacteria bacterium GW2011_GWB1_49_7]|uniref:Uncharacterized protein n=1 Tax=Candidatus Gottesmanbacteria bacterium GW2011_GWB1_49_7 TaxID=1618448 RepID=A0A0G1W2Q4_9BACT|nr:MAG: hypothetical protein UY48_C0006G0051 [Candidatus Gottesmanbacteria bacterium GW2011_GWB1_49_7]